MKRWFSLLLLMFGLAGSGSAADRILQNLNKEGVALQGYDPVAFFAVGGPVKGQAQFSSEYRGARYWFHSAKNKATFEADPAKYEPQFGGYCAYGVSRNALVEIKIDAWQIVDGRLLMQKNQSIRDDFNEDAAGNLKKADEKWPALVSKKGK